MSRSFCAVGPTWPPHRDAYAYTLSLLDPGWDWEFLRRNARYQSDYRRHAASRASSRRLRCSVELTRLRRRFRTAEAWGLRSFRRA